LSARLKKIEGLEKNFTKLLSELTAAIKENNLNLDSEVDCLITYDLSLIVQIVNLAGCELKTSSAESQNEFEIILKRWFDALIKFQKEIASLPTSDAYLLRSLASMTVCLHDLNFLGKREEHVNNLIASLTITADQAAKMEDS
jgi:hypothetical protein